jgi:hypothetical protein
MKKLPIGAVLCLLFWTCVKNNKNSLGDLGGSYTLNGVVMLYDTLTGDYSYAPAGGVTVYIKYSTDPTGYLTFNNATAAGSYSFTGIDSTKAYTVYAHLTADSILYYGSIPYAPMTIHNRESDTLRLYPDSANQNGLYYRLTDSAGGLLAGANFYIFANKDRRDNIDTNNATYHLRSDNFGRVLKMNVSAGAYYLYGVDTSKNQLLSGKTDVTVGSSRIAAGTLALTPAATTELDFSLVDGSSNPVGGCNVYVYNSKDLWDNPDDSTGVGSIYQLVTDIRGKCRVLNADGGPYYIHAYGKFGALVLRGADQFIAPKNTVTVRQIGLTVQ